MSLRRLRALALAVGLSGLVGLITVVPGLAASSTVVVMPGNMQGWFFYDDQNDSTATATGSLVPGPGTPPLGIGSARLTTSSNADGQALILPAYQGTRLADITALQYSTYRTSADPGNLLAIALQFTIDYSSVDSNDGFQGRLVFEPYQGASANPVPQGTWQTWDPRSGQWWASKTTATGSNGLCPQDHPCTWNQVLTNWPDIRIHPTDGHPIVFKAGSGWGTFDGNVDEFTIGVNGNNTTFNFEPYSKDDCKGGGWKNLRRADGSPFKNQGDCVSYTNTGK